MSETKLQELHREQGQSPWLDNLKRGYITSGDLQGMVERGIRGITSNPTIFAKAIEGGGDYDPQFRALVEERTSIDDAYWDLVIDDIRNALRILRPVYDESGGEDGFVSIEVAPGLARNTGETVAAARQLHERINQPNLYVKIPATPEGVPAIRQMVSEGRNINITLMFSLGRYDQVIEAYFQGLEAYQGDLSQVRSVASFFVSRVDTEVDRRLEAIGSDEALGLRGQAAVAQDKLAYQLFRQRFQGGRWEELRARGANLQRPLWASTSTKNPAYSDLLYVETLIGPDTVNTLPEQTIDALEDHGTIARTVENGIHVAEGVFDRLEAIGVDMDDVGRVLEDEGVAAFAKSFDELLGVLERKSAELTS